jgi:hypothetical protein
VKRSVYVDTDCLSFSKRRITQDNLRFLEPMINLNEIYIFGGPQTLAVGLAIMQSHQLHSLRRISLSCASLFDLLDMKLSSAPECWTRLYDRSCFYPRSLAELGLHFSLMSLQQVSFAADSGSESPSQGYRNNDNDGKQLSELDPSSRWRPFGMKILGQAVQSVTSLPMKLINGRIEHLDIAAGPGELVISFDIHSETDSKAHAAEEHQLLSALKLNNLKSLILRLNFEAANDEIHCWVLSLVQEFIEMKIEPSTSLQRLIITWSPSSLAGTYWSKLESSPELAGLDDLISRKLPDLFLVVRLVVTMRQQSELRNMDVNLRRLDFDEFCDRVTLKLFPMCENRRIVRCVRSGEDLLLRNPFDLDLLEGTSTIATAMDRLSLYLRLI